MSHRPFLLYKTIASISVVCFGLFTSCSQAFAFGISPSSMYIDNLLHGTQQSRSVRVLRSGQAVGQELRFRVAFDEVATTMIRGPSEVTILRNEDEALYTYTVDGTTVENGTYRAAITFTQIQDAGAGGGQGAENGQAGASISLEQSYGEPIHIRVSGDQLVAGEVLRSESQDTEVASPVYLDYTVNNIGNVGWTPQQIVMTFTDRDNVSSTQQITFKESEITTSPPGTMTTAHLEKEHRIPVGEYNVSIEFVGPDEKVTKQDIGTPIRIFPENTLVQKGELVDFKATRTDLEPGESVKTEVRFKNTGDVPFKAILILETELNGKLIDTKRSTGVTVGKKEEVILNEPVSFAEPGTYVVSAHIEYGPKSSATKKLTFNTTRPTAVQKQVLTNPLYLTAIALFLLLVFILFILIKRRRAKKVVEQPPTIPPASALPLVPPQPPVVPIPPPPVTVQPAPAISPVPIPPPVPPPSGTTSDTPPKLP